MLIVRLYLQVVLDIATKTCGPCKFIFPKVVQLSQEYPDVVFLKINGDHSDDTKVMVISCWSLSCGSNTLYFMLTSCSAVWLA